MSDVFNIIIVIVVLVFSLLIATAHFNRGIDDWWRDELARRGVAHYYLDAKNKRQWNWIEPQKPEATP